MKESSKEVKIRAKNYYYKTVPIVYYAIIKITKERQNKQMYEFYWYPNCSTCRKAKVMLDRLEIEYNVIDIKATPPTAEQFEKWFEQGDFPVKNFFNTSGLVYRELGLKDKLESMSEAEKASLLASDGMLIKRPLLVKDGKVQLIGFKEKQYETL